MLTRINSESKKLFLSFRKFLLAIIFLHIFLAGITFGGPPGGGKPDKSAPLTPTVIDDGEFTSSTTQLHAIWSSSDPQSGISEYQYSIGTSPDSTNIVGWTSAGLSTEKTVSGLSLTQGQAYYFNVKAMNGSGLWSSIGSSDGITVVGADTTPPQVSITYPSNGATISSTITVSASATDNQAISKVEFYINNTFKSTDTTSPYSYNWDTTAYANGNHAIKATAYDSSNNSASDTITVTVENISIPTIPCTVTSTDQDSNYPAVNTIDSSYSSYWMNNRRSVYPVILTYDFSKLYNLTTLNIWWDSSEYATDYDIKISQDGNTWTELYSHLSETGDSINPYQRSLSVSGQARYIRIQINSVRKFFAQIYEVQIYGTVVPTKIISLTPANNSTFTEGDVINIAVQAQGSSALEYRYSVEGRILQDWTSLNTYSWRTQPGDLKLKTITTEVRDVCKMTDSDNTNVFLYRKAPQPE